MGALLMTEIFAPKETDPRETRSPLVPDTVKRLVGLGAAVTVESGAGAHAAVSDAAFEEAGAKISQDRKGSFGSADIVFRVRKPALEEITLLKNGAIHASFLDPFNEKPLIEAFAKQGVTAVSLEMMPRTTLAQKMDALSSQASHTDAHNKHARRRQGSRRSHHHWQDLAEPIRR